jgi:hypothetical protein
LNVVGALLPSPLLSVSAWQIFTACCKRKLHEFTPFALSNTLQVSIA